MSIPVIDPESSVLAYPQWLHWEHNFSASNAPTAWNVVGGAFPSGMAFEAPLAATADETTDVVTCDGHTFVEGSPVMFRSLSGGAGLSAATLYYVRDVDGITFSLAATVGGAVINITTAMTAALIYQPGHLSGAATLPGISTVRLVASNGSGNSAEVVFTIGIEPAALAPDANEDVVWNIGTGDVIPQVSSVINLVPVAAGVPVLSVKAGDDLLLRVRILKNGTPIDLPATGLRLALKELEPEGDVIVSSAFLKVGTGTNASYLIYAQFDGDLLRSSLSNYEADSGTAYNGLGELEVVYSNDADIGPDEMVKSSATFLLRVVRDILPNEA